MLLREDTEAVEMGEWNLRQQLYKMMSFSPWSNGGNERRHAVVDEAVIKISADNPELSLQQAVDYACFARNNEIGFRQEMFFIRNFIVLNKETSKV